MQVYPWQRQLLAGLASRRAQLPHALLLHGPAGAGKFDFARTLANYLLCRTSDDTGMPCGQCASCGWYAQDNHPDFRLLAPEQGDEAGEGASTAGRAGGRKTQISVDQVRAVSAFLELSSHQSGGLRVVLVHPAEGLGAAAAGALLKMLEEPPADVVFILVTHQLHRLLSTIISRCQQIDMPLPARAEALAWLQAQGCEDAEARLDYAGGAPLSVLRAGTAKADEDHVRLLLQGRALDPFVAAGALLAQGMESAIDCLQKWTYDLLAARLSGDVRYHRHAPDALQALAKSVDLGSLLRFQRQLLDARKAAQHPLRNDLQLEALFLTYTQLFEKSA